jgi:choline dehydrogenase-like flavoprotein
VIDVIVVGSGASAVHAAWPLVAAGRRVLMLDVGNRDERYAPRIPAKPFTEIRRTDDRQADYFLGEDFEGVPFGPVRVGAQLTPPRQHIYRMADQLLPVQSEGFSAMRSFALGGLAAGWGASSPPLVDEDTAGWPISRADLQPHYERVARRIGICGENGGDLAPFHGERLPLLPPPKPDGNAQAILARYRRRRAALNERGIFLGTPRLAMVTRRHRDRGPLANLDMEFWADKDEAVYRPVYTLRELQRHRNFEYRAATCVETFTETGNGVRVTARDVVTGEALTFEAGRLVVAAGTISTSHIVLRSLGTTATRLPLVSNPYTYYPCLVWPTLGKRLRDRRHSLTQLAIFYRPRSWEDALVQAQIYSYRSLLTFKLLKESPLPHREAIRLLQLVQESFVIVGIHHEDRPAPAKYIQLGDGKAGERGLRIAYRPTTRELERRARNERSLMLNFPALGCLPLRRIHPGEGASIHYGGSLPMSSEDRPFTTTPEGRLRGTDRVYIADGAVLPHLPAKGLTFTLMANADRVGSALTRNR